VPERDYYTSRDILSAHDIIPKSTRGSTKMTTTVTPRGTLPTSDRQRKSQKWTRKNSRRAGNSERPKK